MTLIESIACLSKRFLYQCKRRQRDWQEGWSAWSAQRREVINEEVSSLRMQFVAMPVGIQVLTRHNTHPLQEETFQGFMANVLSVGVETQCQDMTNSRMTFPQPSLSVLLLLVLGYFFGFPT